MEMEIEIEIEIELVMAIARIKNGVAMMRNVSTEREESAVNSRADSHKLLCAWPCNSDKLEVIILDLSALARWSLGNYYLTHLKAGKLPVD